MEKMYGVEGLLCHVWMTMNVMMSVNLNLRMTVLVMKQNVGSANSGAPYVQEITLAMPPMRIFVCIKYSFLLYTAHYILSNLLALFCLHFQTCLKPNLLKSQWNEIPENTIYNIFLRRPSSH